MKNIGIIIAITKHYGIKNVGAGNVTFLQMQTIGIINALAKQRGYLKMVGLLKKINAINGERNGGQRGAQKDARRNVLINKSRCCF
jgi:hypothetical protein